MTYRVRVVVADLELGSIDLAPPQYGSFGRTWPIKFLIEKDAELKTQILAAAGMSLWEVADDLRSEFGLCDDELRQLLLAFYPDASDEQIAEVVNGVCQEVILQPNTKIVDKRDTRCPGVVRYVYRSDGIRR